MKVATLATMYFKRSLTPILLAPLKHRTLFMPFTQREIAEHHHGSWIGCARVLINPLMMLLIYSSVFIGVFRMKWLGAENVTGSAHALRLFCGLVVFNLLAEALSRAPALISNQSNLVKKVQSSLEALSFVLVASALFHFVVAFPILLVFPFVFEQPLATMLYVPLVLLPLPFLMLGLSLMLPAIGGYVRDTSPIIALTVNCILFLSPMFYSTTHLTGHIKRFIQLNPLTGIIENLRHSLFTDTPLDWMAWSYFFGCKQGDIRFECLRIHGFA